MKRDIGPAMTKTELIMGCCYLPFYVLLLAVLIGTLSKLLGLGLSSAQINLAYFFLNFGFSLLIFTRYLKRQFRAFSSEPFRGLKAVIVSFAIYFVLTTLLSMLLVSVFGEFSNPNDDSLTALSAIDPRVTFVCAVLLGPLTEEVLMRGLIFGSLYNKSRLLAYCAMIVAFSFIHTWQYIFADPSWTLLLNFLQYIPGALALGWCYESSGSIWSPIFLHMLINLLALSAAS